MNEASVIVLAFSLVAALSAFIIWTRRKPSEESFTCRRCSKKSPFNDRTIQAWRRGKTHFFCNSCHLQWLASQGAKEPVKGGGQGCLRIVLIAISFPICLITLIIVLR